MGYFWTCNSLKTVQGPLPLQVVPRLFPERGPAPSWKGDVPQGDTDKVKTPELQEVFRT